MAGGIFIFPTTNQCITCVQLCLDLTQLYIPIYLVRLDERDQRLIILAGQEIEIVIELDGNWKFLS